METLQNKLIPVSSKCAIHNKKFFVVIREEAFVFGVLPQTCKQLGTKVLQKAVAYIKEKGMFPKMSLSQWIRIGTLKMKMPYDLAWTYFCLFTSITGSEDDFEGSKNFDLTVQQAYDHYKRLKDVSDTSGSDLPVVGDGINIDTYKFLLFLYIQHWNRPYRRLNNGKQDELWPQVAESFQSTRKGAKDKSQWEGRYVKFVSNELHDILTFLQEGEKISDRVELEIMQALDLIIAVADNDNKIEYASLTKLLNNSKIAEAIGYSQSDHCFDKIRFVEWIKEYLLPNPWNSSSPGVVMKEMEALTGTWEGFPVADFNRIWHNDQKPPKLWCTISLVNDQVFFFSQFKMFASLKIHRCDNSYLYIPGVFTYVTVEKCRNTTLFLGPVCRVVRVVSCSKITFHGICRSLIVMDCCNGDFCVMSISQPILCGGKNRNLRLGPYDTFYFDLEKHILKANITKNIRNAFKNPVDLGFDGQPKENVQDLSYKLMKPEEVFLRPFPFGTEEWKCTIPFEMPLEYAQVIDKRKSSAETLKEEIKEATLSEEQRSQLQQILHVRFLTQLHLHGHSKLLSGLEAMEEAGLERPQNQPSPPQKQMPNISAGHELQGKTEEAISDLSKSLVFKCSDNQKIHKDGAESNR